MSNIVWSAEHGWHDGPETIVTVEDGRIISTPNDPVRDLITDPAARTVTAYLSGDGKAITDWHGERLMRVTSSRDWRTGMHGARVYAISATAPDGSRWYGRNSGPGMVITLRRAAGGAR